MCGGQRTTRDSFHPAYGSWDRTQIIRLGSRLLYLLNHLAGPRNVFCLAELLNKPKSIIKTIFQITNTSTMQVYRYTFICNYIFSTFFYFLNDSRLTSSLRPSGNKKMDSLKAPLPWIIYIQIYQGIYLSLFFSCKFHYQKTIGNVDEAMWSQQEFGASPKPLPKSHTPESPLLS